MAAMLSDWSEERDDPKGKTQTVSDSPDEGMALTGSKMRMQMGSWGSVPKKKKTHI
jgi:hypothetical protein